MAIEPGLWEEDPRKQKRRNLRTALLGAAFYIALTVIFMIDWRF